MFKMSIAYTAVILQKECVSGGVLFVQLILCCVFCQDNPNDLISEISSQGFKIRITAG